MRPKPWDRAKWEGLCDRCADRLTARLNQQQRELDRRRPRRIDT
jgi:5-methylcytosine-specific restriction endonuclease McrA